MEASEESGGSIEGINRYIVGCKLICVFFPFSPFYELIDT